MGATRDRVGGELHFSLLGPLQVWQGGVRLDASLWGRLGRELLAFLLVERGRLVPAERLMDVFWPDLAPAAAANNLQRVVGNLRRWLEPGLHRGRDSRFVVTEYEGYRFVTGGGRVDVDEFAGAVQAGFAALRGGDLPGARGALERAREFYRGELLSDMPYAEWTFLARERLREKHLEALEALGDVYLRLGDHQKTLAVCRHARAVDPFREAFVRQEMAARAALGERAEALTVYDRYERLLDAQLGLEPGSDTQTLREAIVAGTVSPAGPTEAASTEAAPLSVELPLVGREDLLERLERIWQEGGGVVLLAAAAGLGKTRLLTEFTQRLGVPVLWSRALPDAPPFAAVLGLFEQYLRGEPPAGQLAVLGALGAPLAERLPTLRRLWADCPAYTPLEGDAEQQRLHQAMLVALRLAATNGSVIVLEDLHWADEASLAVLAEFPLPEQVLLVGTYRSEEAERPLAARRPVELELEPLSVGEVLAAVRAVVGVSDPLPLSRRLHEVTGGHPLFLTETLRGLLDSGRIYRDADGGWHGDVEPDEVPLTSTLREAVLERAGRLDTFEREVLDAAAVLRPRCTPLILGAALQLDGNVVDSALRRLTRRRWLVSADDGWGFSHELTGEAVYAGLAPAQRRLMHRLAAGALIAAPDPSAAEVVDHLVAGGGTPEELAHWAVAAGKEAVGRLSFRRAQTFFRRAEEQLDRLADGEVKRALSLSVYEGLGTVGPHLGESKSALEALEHALSLATTSTDRARLLVAQARVRERDTGEYDRAMELVSEAERLVRDSAEPARLGEIHTIQADVLFWRGEHEEGERLARKAVGESRGAPGERDALRVLSNHLQKRGRMQEAVKVNRELLHLAETIGDMRGLIGGYNLQGLGMFALGRLAEARRTLEQARDICERVGDFRSLSITYTNTGMTSGALGELDRAETELRRAVELAEQIGAPYTVVVARHLRGQVLTARGRLKEAGAELQAAVEKAAVIDARVVEAQARLNLGLWHWARGDPAAAATQAHLTLAAGDSLGDNFCRRESRILLGLVSLEAGDVDSAERYAREAHQIAGAAQQVLAVGRAERLLGRVAAARKELEAAETRFAESEAIFRRSGAPIELGQTLLARAECGITPDRRAVLLEARRLFRRTEARPFLKQVERLLANG